MGLRTPPRWQALVFSLLLVAGTLGVFVSVLTDLLREPPPPRVQVAPSPPSRLATQLVFVVLDGLRYDYATDPARAPSLARHMTADAHGEVWAGRVTMTSAAVLTFGTGVRGEFAQLIANLNVGRVQASDLISIAREKGLRSGLVGDEVWVQSFGKLDVQVTDEQGLSIETDNSEVILAAAERVVREQPSPDLLVVHVIAPDHQGHAHGTASPRYLEFLKTFDARLERFVSSLPETSTLIVVSDHGATDTGAHGADTPIERRTPLYARGPGIRPGVDIGRAEQVDLAPTMAALLGLPAPSHGRGVTLTELLAVDDAHATSLACADRKRLATYGATFGGDAARIASTLALCPTAASPAAFIADTRSQARSLDTAIDESRSSASRANYVVTVVSFSLPLLLGASLLAYHALRRRGALARLSFGLGALAMSALCVFLTYRVERITPPFHNVTRAALFVVGNGLLAYLLFRPSAGASLFRRSPALMLSLLPGALAFSYTANTQAESLVVLATMGLLWLLAPHADALSSPSLLRPETRAPLPLLGTFLLGLFLLVPAGIKQDDPAVLASTPGVELAVAAASIACAVALLAPRRDAASPRIDVALGMLVAVGSLLARRVAPWQLGVTAELLLPVVALVALARRRRTLALGLWLGAYAWVSRDFEVPSVAGALLALESLGLAISSVERDDHPDPMHRPFVLASVAGLAFSALFLARVGLQRGLDFSNIDWGAGTFRDPSPAQWRVGGSAIWKYLCVDLALLWALVSSLSTRLRVALLWVFSLVALGRAGTLGWMLFACRTSFWTCYRGIGDIPTALVTALASAVALFVGGGLYGLSGPMPRRGEHSR